MSQAPDWLLEEERLERLACAGDPARSESTDLQRNCRLRAAFDWAAVLMVILFLGLLCWNWNARTPASDAPDRIEYKNAFYRALDEGSPFPGRPRTVYPPGFVVETDRPNSRLDPLLLPAGDIPWKAWLDGKDAGKLQVDGSLKVKDLDPPEPVKKKKKVWTPVRDLYGEVPRGID